MDPYGIKDNRMMESEQRVQVSHQSDLKDSRKRNGKLSEDNDSSIGNRTRTRTQKWNRDPDKDRLSDGDQSSASAYSDDYENTSLSDRSFSPPSPSPSPSPYRGAKTQTGSRSPRRPTGVRKGAPRRPGPQTLPPQQRSSGLRSQSHCKDASPKDLDQVTKRLLSARLLKISELKNALAELQLHTDELQRENRLLKQLQLRHEKALHRYSDTESEISQLISRHNNETHTLRERLRRSQEKERAAERRYTEADAQLQRCRDQLHKLQKLADDQRLGERDDLARKLTHAQVKLQDSECRVKELEKNMELSTGHFQRQLASERKKTHDALQEAQTLREEMVKLNAKLKERERELDTRNIYANRMLRGASKKDLEDATRKKGASRSSSKAVQTEDRKLSLDFPPPPLAITNGSEFSSSDQVDDYLSLKKFNQEQQSSEPEQTETEDQKIQQMAKEQEKEKAQGLEMQKWERDKDRLKEQEREIVKEKEKVPKQIIKSNLDRNEEEESRPRDGWDKEEEDWKRQIEWKAEEELMSEQEIQANQERAEEERRRKDLLLAKMCEIDMQAQAQGSGFFHDKTGSTQTSQNQNTSIFNFTEPNEALTMSMSEKRGGALRSQKNNQDLDLTFGSYAPSFGKPAPRAGVRQRGPVQTVDHLSGDKNVEMDLSGLPKEKKVNLMEQLFGSAALPAPHESPSKMELLSSPSTRSSSGGRRRDADTPTRQKRTTLHISESGPAVRAITALNDDIEELAL